jgi:hypothetical protein
MSNENSSKILNFMAKHFIALVVAIIAVPMAGLFWHENDALREQLKTSEENWARAMMAVQKDSASNSVVRNAQYQADIDRSQSNVIQLQRDSALAESQFQAEIARLEQQRLTERSLCDSNSEFLSMKYQTDLFKHDTAMRRQITALQFSNIKLANQNRNFSVDVEHGRVVDRTYMTNHSARLLRLSLEPESYEGYLKSMEDAAKRGDVSKQESISMLEELVLGLAEIQYYNNTTLAAYNPIYERVMLRLSVKQMPPDKRLGFLTAVFSPKYRRELGAYEEYVGQTNALEDVRRDLEAGFKTMQTTSSKLDTRISEMKAEITRIESSQSTDTGEMVELISTLRSALAQQELLVKVETGPEIAQAPTLEIEQPSAPEPTSQ